MRLGLHATHSAGDAFGPACVLSAPGLPAQAEGDGEMRLGLPAAYPPTGCLLRPKARALASPPLVRWSEIGRFPVRVACCKRPSVLFETLTPRVGFLGFIPPRRPI